MNAMNPREIVQIVVLVVLFVGTLTVYRRLRDAGAASVDDRRDPPPGPPPASPDRKGSDDGERSQG